MADTGMAGGTRPRKKYGQHFLHNRNVLDKMIAAIAPGENDHFIEIGPGRGALTRPLLPRVGQLDVIEIDGTLAGELQRRLKNARLHIHRADALGFDYRQLCGEPGRLRVAGNLPYNISSPLIFHLLGFAGLFRDIHVLLQKEVVTRMTTGPGSRAYGRLSVALAARCRVEYLFDVRPGSFTPRPKADSAFVRLAPDAARRATIRDEQVFDRVLKQAFSMRRKQIANALAGLVTPATLERAGIAPDVRAEQVDVAGFIRLANCQAEAGPADG